jgi:hypothetical protein
MNKSFSLLYKKLIERKTIEVSISDELEIWNDADDNQQETVKNFFAEFIFIYGSFHELLGKSKAHGVSHDLKISIIDGNILMKGKTYLKEQWMEDDQEDDEEDNCICFKWIFDKKGNLILIE